MLIIVSERVEREREFRLIYFKELAHTIVEAGASASSRAGQQAGSSGGISVLQS